MSVAWVGRVLLAAVFALGAACPSLAAPGKRIALVIGNSAYQHTSLLANPANDAEDMAATLSALGFEVTKRQDLKKHEMDSTLGAFAGSLKGAEIGLFFYAGHGLQVSGQNYLVPVDAKLETASALDFEAVRLDVIQRIMENETQTNVLILDACRDNPLTRNLARSMGARSSAIGKGLAPQESGAGTIISYSTQPGNVALDGTGKRNSPFAEALVKYLPSEGRGLPSVLVNVRNDVMAATAKRQVPWEHSALTSELVLAAAKPVPAAKPTAEAETGNASRSNSAAASPIQLTLPLKKLTFGLDHTLRFFVLNVFAGLQECQLQYATSDSPKMSQENLKAGEYIDIETSGGRYRGMLLEVTTEHCQLQIAPAQGGNAATKGGG